MSWFGDQFNNIAGKITDLTKEVLNENTTNDLAEAESNRNGFLSYEELISSCKEKDEKICLLMQEKEILEKSIEELSEQHQEAINILLPLKNQAEIENKLLREKLSNHEAELAATRKQNFQNCNYERLKKDLGSVLHSKMNLSSKMADSEEDDQDINFIMLLQLLSKNCTEDSLRNKIKWLENRKQSLGNDACEEDKDTAECLIYKIDNYINFLQTLNSNHDSLFPVISEMFSAFELLVSDIVQLNQKLNSLECEYKNYISSSVNDENSLCNSGNFNESSKSDLKIRTSESFAQTNTLIAVDICAQTDVCSYLSQDNLNTSSNSRHSQTEDTNDDVKKENLLLKEFQFSANTLEQDKTRLQEEINRLTSLLNKPSLSALTQTDVQTKCECETLKTELNTARNACIDLEQKCSTIQKTHLDNLSSLKEKLNIKESKITDKDNIIQSQKKEVMLMKDRIKGLTDSLNVAKSKLNFSNLGNGSIGISAHNGASQQNKMDGNVLLLNNETNFLQEKVSSLELEKGKLLCVLNEKSRECSGLKSEVHKLTSIVASEKQALLKLQQDNCELKDLNKDNSDPELTKETIKKLSSIIRDKDFEIESLKQKNSTLTILIQDVSNIPDHLQSLLEEKENLSKQICVYKAEREKFMASYNSKDKECRKFATEIKELSSSLSQQREKFDVLEQKHLSVAQQYEEKQKSLINTQNEMIALKQRVTDLEQQQVDIKEKYSQLLNKLNSDSIIQITKEELNEKNDKIERFTCTSQEKDHLIQEKDCMIHDLSQQVKKLKLESDQHQDNLQNLERKVLESSSKVSGLKSSVEQSEKDKQILEQKIQDKISEASLLKDMNERLNMALKEKEFTIKSMTEKVSSLSQYINRDHSSSGTMDINQILADSESMFSKAQDMYRERDETLLALNQSKQENQNLRNEIQRMKSGEIHSKNELDRLREHLIEIEENYTSEALKAEQKEKRLQDELVEVRRRAEITSTAVVDTNQRASVQIASLQEQLSMIVNQRDDALAQMSSLEDQVLHHSTAVGKLQLLLEQMQKGNEQKHKEAENKWKLMLEKQKKEYQHMERKLQAKERQLEESSQALEAATRLSEQLDAKEEVIAFLKDELSKTENKIKSTAEEIDSIKSNTEGKVDRVVMKSLVLGYFSTPPGQKSEVIRLLARVLDFNQEEMEKAGIIVGRHIKPPENKGIFSSIFSRLPSMAAADQNQRPPQKSFTTLFVQFLENESQPIVPLPFPIERMAQEQLVLKTQGGKKPQIVQDKDSPRKSHLLMDIDSAFPTFTPVPAVEYSIAPAPAILKEVLE